MVAASSGLHFLVVPVIAAANEDVDRVVYNRSKTTVAYPHTAYKIRDVEKISTTTVDARTMGGWLLPPR